MGRQRYVRPGDQRGEGVEGAEAFVAVEEEAEMAGGEGEGEGGGEGKVGGYLEMEFRGEAEEVC